MPPRPFTSPSRETDAASVSATARPSRAARIVLGVRAVCMLSLAAIVLMLAACTRGRPVKIVRTDESTIVGTLVAMRPDAVDIADADGTPRSEPRATIASITAPSELELAMLRMAPGAQPGMDADAGRDGPGPSARRNDPTGPGGATNPPADSSAAPDGGAPGLPSSGHRPGSGPQAPGQVPGERQADGRSSTGGPGVPAGPGGGHPASGESADADRSSTGTHDGGQGPAGPADGRGSRGPALMIPAETVLTLSLDTALDSDASRAEQPVDATLRSPVTVGRAIVVPAGARLRGDIVEALPARQAGGRGRLAIRFHTVVIDGKALSIAAAPLRFVAARFTKDDAKKVGVGAAAGAIVGGIWSKTRKGLGIGAAAGGAGTAIAVSRNNEMRLARGTTLRVRLTAPVSLP